MLSFHFMAINFLLNFCLISLALAGSHGTLSEEERWISVFPNTPMPKALKDLLPPYGVDVITAKGVNVNTGKQSKGVDVNPFVIYEKKSEAVDVNPFVIYEKKSEAVDVNPFVIYEKKSEAVDVNPFVIYEKKSEAVDVSPSVIYEKKTKKVESKGVNDFGNPFIIYGKQSKGVKDFGNPFIIYGKESKGLNSPAKASKGNKNPLGRKHGNAAMNETMYFFQDNLHPGKMVKLPLLTKTKDSTTFLPQELAQSIPFSSDKLSQILEHFPFDSESIEANAMELTIKGCEREVMPGEQMFCATSFDSFVDSSVSKLGKDIQLLANEIGKETNNPVFTIGRGIQNMGEDELVCHKMMYPYAVFSCHSIGGTEVYKVPLVGIDGTKAKALAICHKDTSAWSPDHPAFHSLKIKPGTVPICHFVVRDTLVWVRK